MEIYLRDLAEQQALTNTVTALVHNHNFKKLSSPTVIETKNKVQIIRQKTLKPILFTPIMLATNKVVNQLINDDKVDVIHISWPNPSALFLLLNKKAKTKPWVIQWQSDMVTENSSWLLKFAYKFFRPFEKKLLSQSTKIIASTKEYFNHSNALKKFEDKCEFIPLGLKQNTTKISSNDINWANKQWGNTQYKIYNIGRLTFYKNHQLLIDAAELLPEAQFIITGSGDLENSLKKRVQQKSLTNIVFTAGLSQNKLNALLSTCDAFCLPSNDRAESYGMVLLEALSFNKRILVSNLPGSGMKWIAAQSNVGQIFDCNSAENLVNKIKAIDFNIGTDKPKNSMTNEIFNIDYCSEKINQLYQSIL